ncbi:hypothetical protein BV22DRAFT_1049936 [Leucogyrophana mollusca]|uniref:Uncharacterized protein n=1 Tax=Leucogyrophana mollusca TaxID=85980 RepID=A0ACB8B7W2_9AGAM|nr:hypothetical protein BV22DRAFT_1049936 [Leucogyrophana mollusca]
MSPSYLPRRDTLSSIIVAVPPERFQGGSSFQIRIVPDHEEILVPASLVSQRELAFWQYYQGGEPWDSKKDQDLAMGYARNGLHLHFRDRDEGTKPRTHLVFARVDKLACYLPIAAPVKVKYTGHTIFGPPRQASQDLFQARFRTSGSGNRVEDQTVGLT